MEIEDLYNRAEDAKAKFFIEGFKLLDPDDQRLVYDLHRKNRDKVLRGSRELSRQVGCTDEGSDRWWERARDRWDHITISMKEIMKDRG